jgi:hypothetical protein
MRRGVWIATAWLGVAGVGSAVALKPEGRLGNESARSRPLAWGDERLSLKISRMPDPATAVSDATVGERLRLTVTVEGVSNDSRHTERVDSVTIRIVDPAGTASAETPPVVRANELYELENYRARRPLGTYRMTPEMQVVSVSSRGTVSRRVVGTTKPLEVSDFEIVVPHGDPAAAAGPRGANDTNERCYSADLENPTLTVPCRARCPSDPDKLRWIIGDAGSIKAKWNPHVDGNEYVGKGLSTTATFTGMPENNRDFGPKTITLTKEGADGRDTRTVELFFDPIATNNPGPEPDDIPRNVDPRSEIRE